MRTRTMMAALTVAALASGFAAAAVADEVYEREVVFPKAKDGRLILTADLHTHTVFSDGEVWPSIRVEEAHRDGVNLLSITDHLEHQPKKADIPNPDRNRGHVIATETLTARKYPNLNVVMGAEITRMMPPGHMNAVFLQDANAILTDDVDEAVRRANAQGAFVFWNHPNWTPQAPDGIARIRDMHKDWIKKGQLHGIEVVNGTMDGHSEHALQIALEYNLTVLGTSDIHGLVDWTHRAWTGGRRPMTIVLAKENTVPAMKEALFKGATVALKDDDMLGREDNVRAVVESCLSLAPQRFEQRSTVLFVNLQNACPVRFTLRNTGALTFQNVSDTVVVERRATFPLAVRMGDGKGELALTFEVLNAQVGFRKSPSITLKGAIPRNETPPPAQ